MIRSAFGYIIKQLSERLTESLLSKGTWGGVTLLKEVRYASGDCHEVVPQKVHLSRITCVKSSFLVSSWHVRIRSSNNFLLANEGGKELLLNSPPWRKARLYTQSPALLRNHASLCSVAAN